MTDYAALVAALSGVRELMPSELDVLSEAFGTA
jgi:hypothetical protein